MKLVWLSDIHLNFLSAEERTKLYTEISQQPTDICVITGDIAESPNLTNELTELQDACPHKKFYFVLGNHDFYRGGIKETRKRIMSFDYLDMYYLTDQTYFFFDNMETVLLGHDGWADGRYGDYVHSSVMLNDFNLIQEFIGKTKYERLGLMENYARQAHSHIKEMLEIICKSKQIKNIIIATHVSPFADCALYRGKVSSPETLPFYASKVMGDLLLEFAQKNSAINFTVLCGHTHGECMKKISSNLTVYVNGSDYGKPIVQTNLIPYN